MVTRPASVVGALSISFAVLGCSPAADQNQVQLTTTSGESPSETAGATPALPVDLVALPEGRSDEGWKPDAHLELLCNPDTHQFVLQTSPPQYREVDGYPKRHLWDVDDLFVSMWEGFRGDQGYTGSRRSFARCGDYVIVVEADKANWNWRGRGGAHDPYFAVRIANDFATVYPNEEKYLHSRLVPMGGASAMWSEEESRGERGCPAQMVSAIDVRPDRDAEATKINLIVRDPGAEFKRGAYNLDDKRDYSDCSRAVHGNQTSIGFWDTSNMQPGRKDAPWIF